MSDWKTFFTANFPLKLYRATVANADTGSLKFLHTIFDTYLDNMLAIFQPKSIFQNVQSLRVFFFFTKTGVTVAETIVK